MTAAKNMLYVVALPSGQTENAYITTSKCIKVTTKCHSYTTRNSYRAREYLCHATTELTELEFYHVARHCLNVCDIIISAQDKFL